MSQVKRTMETGIKMYPCDGSSTQLLSITIYPNTGMATISHTDSAIGLYALKQVLNDIRYEIEACCTLLDLGDFESVRDYFDGLNDLGGDAA